MNSRICLNISQNPKKTLHEPIIWKMASEHPWSTAELRIFPAHPPGDSHWPTPSPTQADLAAPPSFCFTSSGLTLSSGTPEPPGAQATAKQNVSSWERARMWWETYEGALWKMELQDKFILEQNFEIFQNFETHMRSSQSSQRSSQVENAYYEKTIQISLFTPSCFIKSPCIFSHHHSLLLFVLQRRAEQVTGTTSDQESDPKMWHLNWDK